MSTNTISVSKGVFVYKNGGISRYKRLKSKQTNFDDSNIFSDTLWYQSYRKLWSTIESKIETLNNEMFSNLLRNLVLSVKDSYSNCSPVTEIPTAILLTGINMPDHTAQFSTLATEIKKSVSPHVAVLYPENCQNLKYTVENTISQLINNVTRNDDDEDENKKSRTRKSHCTFALLKSWYENMYGSPEHRKPSPSKRRLRNEQKLLVVIVPDFESINEKVIQDFIIIMSSYLNALPFALIFGVATSLTAVHKSLPYHVSSKINVHVFNSQASTLYLNNIIENVLFTDDCPFHLGGKVFNFFTDIFLFYDLSVKGFVKNFRFAILEHFSYGNLMALCNKPTSVKRVIEKLSHDDFEDARRLPSFKKFATAHKNKEKLKDDGYFKEILQEEIKSFFMYLNLLHVFIKCLHVLVHDLPKAPLGKHIRELYSSVTSKSLATTPEFKECFQLLAFQSKDELTSKISKICEIIELESAKSNNKIFDEIISELENHVDRIENVTTEEAEEKLDANARPTEDVISGKMDRKQLKQKLLELSKKNKPMNKYEKIRSELVKYLQGIFEEHLQEPSSKCFHEIFFFNNLSIKKYIIGSHRAAIHAALNNPQHYLQCKCCELPNDTKILHSMPDISILYKLHLEYGKWINLHDWLQSFICIVDPEENEDDNEEEETKRIVKPELHARFTQAVTDLEYLGLIKNSKRKADHVARLTWGG